MKKLMIALLLVMATACSDNKSRELNFYNWTEYMPEEVLTQFTAETGIKVRMSTYDSNEAMYAKVKLTGSGYDLIVPSSYYVGLMRRQGLLLPLDKDKLPNFTAIAPKFLNQPFDPDNQYSIPYLWGSTALAVDTGQLDGVRVTSFADLWKPELEGKLVMPNDVRDIMGIGLKRLGYSVNETDPAKLQEAYELLRSLMGKVRVFDSDSPKLPLLSGEVVAGVMWNGEAFIASEENPMVTYVYPTEGFSLWMDNVCIPKGAANSEEAHQFLNFLMRPDIAARISEEMGYATPNTEALQLLSQDFRNNSIVFPPAEVLARGEFQDDLGEAAKLYDDLWIKLKGE